jgi:hypothetical protein
MVNLGREADFRDHPRFDGRKTMAHRIYLSLALAFAAVPLCAQTQPGLPGGAGLPDVSKMGVPNVAGVLGYCVKNRLLSGTGATSVLDGLKGKSGVTASPDYSAGEAGNIITGSGSPVSLGAMPAQLKTQACNAVLRHGSSLL